jgi:small-conductance mechanosensitive channel
VEGTLSRTAPGQAFSGAVLAALPLTMGSVATATAGAAAKGSTAAKLSFWGAWLAPIIGIGSGMVAHWLVIRSAPTEAERRAKKIAFTSLWAFVLLWCFVGQLGLRALSRRFEWSDQLYFSVMAAFWWVYAAVCGTLTIVMIRRFLALRQQSENAGERPRANMRPLTSANRIVVTAGIYLAFFSWLALVAWQFHDHGSAVIIVGLMVGLSVWHFADTRRKIGLAAMRAVAGHLALCWGVILVILNLRLDVWMAAAHRCSLAEIHSLFPAWVVPVLTLALLLWAGLILKLTKPVRRG